MADSTPDSHSVSQQPAVRSYTAAMVVDLDEKVVDATSKDYR